MLPAVECAQCKAFFRALASWGGPQEREDAASAGVHCKHGEGGAPPSLPACPPACSCQLPAASSARPWRTWALLAGR
jgi:hypothetical protein